MDWAILLSGFLVFALYAAVAVRGGYAAYHVSSGGLAWTRKATLSIMAGIAIYWSAFYIHLLLHIGVLPDSAQKVAMGSRIGHALTAVGMWTIMSLLHLVAEQYKQAAVLGEGFE